MFRFIRTFFLTLFLVSFCVVGYFSYTIYQEFNSYRVPKDTFVKIDKGASVKSIARSLEKNKVVPNKFVFEGYLRATDQARLLKAGEYEFPKGDDILAVIDRMIEGKVKVYKFTLPEGYNVNEVCDLLDKKKLSPKEVCRKLVRTPSKLTHKIEKEIQTLEGYLFPETYLYDSEVNPEKIIDQMLAMFYKKLTPERINKAKEMGLSIHDLVTFASIVEKETAVSEERPFIASVFHNRLKIGMLLQTDPTVIYGIEDYDGNIRKKDLKTDHPYNTYTRPGLPYGPISNVGEDAIEAVLNPANTDYLYFVAKGGGKHYFSKSLEEHNRAVQYYILKRGAPMPEQNLF